ncbi:MAG: RNA polymerase sigma-70 factor [Bacteroidales bacterium]|nr:RNA polymerase sigma-70 factor [Bacteroidales bacterium]
MKAENNTSFEDLYVLYYSRMKRFAKEYVLLEEDAENIVHDVFTDLWERWDVLSSHNNLFAFLFLSLKNKCIDFLRHKATVQKVESATIEEYQLALRVNYYSLESFDQNLFTEKDIETIINKALDHLPEQCRKIFVKNKIEGKKQKEIAEELNISVNTVENQMAIAYKKLRKELKDLLPLFLFLLS